MLPPDRQYFSLTPGDQLYEVTIPDYTREGDVVLYHVVLKDLIFNQTHLRLFRFKDLKRLYDGLSDLKVTSHLLQLELPRFPKTHFFHKTNRSKAMIKERMQQLEFFLKALLNDPFTRGDREVRAFIRLFTKNSGRRWSQSRVSQSGCTRKTKSASKAQSSSNYVHAYMN